LLFAYLFISSLTISNSLTLRKSFPINPEVVADATAEVTVEKSFKSALFQFLAEKFFRNIDLNHDGSLSKDEFIQGVKSICKENQLITPTDESLVAFYNIMDVQGKDAVTRVEFKSWLIPQIVNGNNEFFLRILAIISFGALDTDKSGDLSIDEFIQGFKNFQRIHKIAAPSAKKYPSCNRLCQPP
jgi:hypothetical protein